MPDEHLAERPDQLGPHRRGLGARRLAARRHARSADRHPRSRRAAVGAVRRTAQGHRHRPLRGRGAGRGAVPRGPPARAHHAGPDRDAGHRGGRGRAGGAGRHHASHHAARGQPGPHLADQSVRRGQQQPADPSGRQGALQRSGRRRRGGRNAGTGGPCRRPDRHRLCRGHRPHGFRRGQDRRPDHPHAAVRADTPRRRRCRGAAETCGPQRRPDLHDPLADPQSDRTARPDGGVGGREADRSRRDPDRRLERRDAGEAFRAQAVGRAGAVALRRRRLRRQGVLGSPGDRGRRRAHGRPPPAAGPVARGRLSHDRRAQPDGTARRPGRGQGRAVHGADPFRHLGHAILRMQPRGVHPGHARHVPVGQLFLHAAARRPCRGAQHLHARAGRGGRHLRGGMRGGRTGPPDGDGPDRTAPAEHSRGASRHRRPVLAARAGPGLSRRRGAVRLGPPVGHPRHGV